MQYRGVERNPVYLDFQLRPVANFQQSKVNPFGIGKLYSLNNVECKHIRKAGVGLGFSRIGHKIVQRGGWLPLLAIGAIGRRAIFRPRSVSLPFSSSLSLLSSLTVMMTGAE